jgi:hypothetical protein
MKYLISFIMLLALIACDDFNKPHSSLTPLSPSDSIFVTMYGNERKFDSYQVIMIDGCEYIAYKSNNTQFLSIEHKGNCKNPIHYQVKHDTVYVVKETGLVLQKQLKK